MYRERKPFYTTFSKMFDMAAVYTGVLPSVALLLSDMYPSSVDIKTKVKATCNLGFPVGRSIRRKHTMQGLLVLEQFPLPHVIVNDHRL